MISLQPPPDPLLVVRKLVREFQTPDRRRQFGVSVDAIRIDRQEIAVMQGHTGSGKTSVFHQLALRDRPTRVESFRLGNDDLAAAWESERTISEVRRKIGATSQRPALIDALSAGENVEIRRQLAGLESDAEWLQFILEGLSCRDVQGRPDLLQLVNYPVHRISGGQAQRLEIAREVSHRPELLILDEPTSSLDPATGLVVIQFLNQLCRDYGVTLLIVTHDFDLVQPYATQVIRMQANEFRQGVVVSTEHFRHPAA